ncbi:hypothetical protein CO705_07440 [Ralstonia pickettii]|nr:hypothetical protein CO705_07440 [Ralstonia pickettii]
MGALTAAGVDDPYAAYAQLARTGQLKFDAKGTPIVRAGQELYLDSAIAADGDKALGRKLTSVEGANRIAIAEQLAEQAKAQAAADALYREQQRMAGFQSDNQDYAAQQAAFSRENARLAAVPRTMLADVPQFGADGSEIGISRQVVTAAPATSYAEDMAHLGQVAIGVGEGAINGVPKMVMGAAQLITQGAMMQGQLEAGVDPTTALRTAQQGTAGWWDGTILPYANTERQIGGMFGELLSPSVYAKGFQVGARVLSALDQVQFVGSADSFATLRTQQGMVNLGGAAGDVVPVGNAEVGATSAAGATGEVPSMGWPGKGGSGPAPGTIGITDSTSTKALQNYNPRGGGVEFVYDPATNTFVAGKPATGLFDGSPHEQLARTFGSADNPSLVGGTFQRGPNGEFFTTENSGHYGANWNGAVRAQFSQWLSDRLGLPVVHQTWNGGF